MSLSNSRLAYTDCYELLDKALDEPRGIRVEVPDLNAATYLRMRIQHARAINRAENEKTFPDPADPLHGRSVYDIFVVRIEDAGDHAWVYLDKQKVELGKVESIPEGHQIEAPRSIPQLVSTTDEIVIENPVEIETQKQIPYLRRR